MPSRDGRADLIASRCPTCDGPATWRGNPVRPFCSVRCKLVDLGAWIDERYRVPGPPVAGDPGEPGIDRDGRR